MRLQIYIKPKKGTYDLSNHMFPFHLNNLLTTEDFLIETEH